jgi:putative hydrolase of the HAD superfamily
MIRAIAFDADDTLWHTETLFQETQTRLAEILGHYAPPEEVQRRLHATEERNVKAFGYGVKGFTLSMVETAIEISGGRISASDIHTIVTMGRGMLEAPMRLLDDVPQTLAQLRPRFPLYLVTKGDLLDQQNKIDTSGLADQFTGIEVVARKDAAAYRDFFARHGVDPASVLMVGNSIPSDVLPVLEVGGWAVHIPYVVTASFERHDQDPAHARYARLNTIRELPAHVDRIAGGGAQLEVHPAITKTGGRK